MSKTPNLTDNRRTVLQAVERGEVTYDYRVGAWRGVLRSQAVCDWLYDQGYLRIQPVRAGDQHSRVIITDAGRKALG